MFMFDIFVVFYKIKNVSFSNLKQRGNRYGHRHNQRSQSLNRGQALSRAEVGGMW